MAEGRGMMTRSKTAAAQETATNVTTPRGRGRGIRQTPPSTVGETPPRAVGETPPRAVGETPPRTVGETPPRSVGETPPDCRRDST
jgi:hypothetical protein